MLVDLLYGHIGPPNLCSLLSVEWLSIFEDTIQSLLNMCLYDVCSLIPTEQHTNQM